MANFKKDFNVDITKLTKAVSQRGFGTILILATDKEHPYTLYNDITALASDFAAGTKTNKIASRIFGQSPSPQEVAVVGMDYSTGLPTDLVDFLSETLDKNSDWFFLTCDNNTEEVVKALSGFIDTQDKMYFATTQDLTLPSMLESENTAIYYHEDKDAYLGEGMASYFATATVGGVTGKFKTVQGVLAADIGATELAQLHTDNGQSYVRKMGVLQTTEGKTTSGEYIDVVMGAFWIKFKMEEDAAYLSLNTPKIPYSNRGIGMLISVVENVLKRGTLQDIILEEDGKGVYEINYTLRENVSKNDIANRVYNEIKWTATLSGAIHGGTISGILKY